MSYITELFNHYGYIVLYVALTLELIALPTPGESLMTYCGYLAFQGQLNYFISMLVAAAGVITGITVSYLIGKLWGNAFFTRYGSYIHLGPEKIERTSKWFEKYGNGLLIVAYFIPGIRHITGYFAGVTRISYRKFAMFAYPGAVLWTGVFISLGKLLGPSWEQYHAAIKKYLILGGVILGIVLICIYIYRGHKQQINKAVINFLIYLLRIFHHLGRVRIAVTVTALAFIGLIVLVAGLIQDFLANEFGRFDTIAAYIIGRLFDGRWSGLFSLVKGFTDYRTLIAVTAAAFILIVIKGRNRVLETGILIFTVLGGEALEELLRILFRRVGPVGSSPIDMNGTFPSEQSLMAIVTYGFAAYIIVHHANSRRIGGSVILCTLLIAILSGLSPLFFQSQYPSDVSAGYVFGGAWLSMNIVLLEVLRILPQLGITENS